MELEKFAPLSEKLELSEKDRYSLQPFFTNLDKSVFAVTFLPPEVIGALCSRTSRAKEDLRTIFLNEFIKPFLQKENEYGKSLNALIDFLHKYPIELIFSNPKGREFYIKWLAQFGDDSIAQMAGTHLIYSALSQVTIKHFEDMRLGIAPIEKSTRYVDYSSKIDNHYRYYIDPTLEKMGLIEEYRGVMDGLFETYSSLLEKYFEYLKKHYPEEKESLLKTKTFDTIRKILPTATLSQISFFGNGQAFEYLINRSLNHKLGEIRWAGQRAFEELSKIIPAFLRRVESEDSQKYRTYLSERGSRVQEALKQINWRKEKTSSEAPVRLLEYDSDGENKIIASLLYLELHEPYEQVLQKVRRLSTADKEKILQEVLKDRKFKYYKIPRAFENAYLKFEILMNIGAWRDLHRHRIHTQYRERFNVYNGFDIPEELKEASLDREFSEAVSRVAELFQKVEKVDPDVAQYCCALGHRIRFIQYQNLRSFFWETELRTIPEGHPDYRRIEQEKIRLVQKIYPLIGKYLLVDMGSYDFARRKASEKIEKKEKELKQYFQQKS
ncbi:FAD-dependent thymidylate synthase [Patescibacteria group bacterium]|nr:FAD-dependent thymidylate synthase [Patescibacteria group bacterium]